MEVLLFGIAREIVGTDRLSIPVNAGLRDVGALRAWLTQNHQQLNGLRALAIAVNKEYAENDQTLDDTAEIALIPPVSGG